MILGSHAGECKVAVFGIVGPCNLLKFTSISEVLAASIIRERTSEMLVNFYQTTQCYKPEDRHLCLY
jgi:hypothetical protein